MIHGVAGTFRICARYLPRRLRGWRFVVGILRTRPAFGCSLRVPLRHRKPEEMPVQSLLRREAPVKLAELLAESFA
jgi:hypothetical protein